MLAASAVPTFLFLTPSRLKSICNIQPSSGLSFLTPKQQTSSVCGASPYVPHGFSPLLEKRRICLWLVSALRPPGSLQAPQVIRCERQIRNKSPLLCVFPQVLVFFGSQVQCLLSFFFLAFPSLAKEKQNPNTQLSKEATCFTLNCSCKSCQNHCLRSFCWQSFMSNTTGISAASLQSLESDLVQLF